MSDLRFFESNPLADANNNMLITSDSDFLPSDLANLKAWYQFNTGITVTGAGVSTWADQSGNGNDLLQSTDTNRPSKEANGTILFDGVDNFLRAASVTLTQPVTIYLIFKQVTWTSADYFYTGTDGTNGLLLQQFYSTGDATPDIRMYSGANGPEYRTYALDTYGVTGSVFNTTSSTLFVNGSSVDTGSVGTTNGTEIILGAANSSAGNAANIQVAEMLVYTAAHGADEAAQVNTYGQSIIAGL